MAAADAVKRGKTAEVNFLDEEKDRIENGEEVSDTDDALTPAGLKTLRTQYRAAIAKINATRAKNAGPVFDKYLTGLDAEIARLTNANKTKEAAQSKRLRDQVALDKLQITAAPAAK